MFEIHRKFVSLSVFVDRNEGVRLVGKEYPRSLERTVKLIAHSEALLANNQLSKGRLSADEADLRDYFQKRGWKINQ